MKAESAPNFQDFTLGTPQPISVPMETIEVIISEDNLMGGFAKSFIREGYRVNPLRAEQIDLTPEELEAYQKYLFSKRIECINNVCKDFRRLKVLYIPSWIQFNLSMIGEVIIRDRGLRLIPRLENDEDIISFEEAVLISDKIGMFKDDLQIVKDAMPRGIEGDKDVMSTALIAGYVRSLHKVDHVVSTYVTGFLGMKLKQEAAMKVLYRVQYDDLDFIASALLTQKGLY